MAMRTTPLPVPADPHSWADLSQGITETVELDLRADFASRRLVGSAVLSFREPLRGGSLDLDSRGLEIQAVEADGTALRWTMAGGDAVRGERLRVETTPGVERITIRYATSPEATALQWLRPEQTAGKRHPFLFSQCQQIHARSVAPLQDTPVARIRYTARIDVPKGLTALMSARTVRREDHGDRTVWTLEMNHPIPPYLLALAVGELASRDLSERCRVWAEPAFVEASAREFEDVERMIEAAERLFGPYDWDRFDMLVMPPSFPYGGMENPCMTFLTPTLLAGDKSLVDVVAHELAHSWTGNLVSNANAEHFWLNEGFTVYAERRIVEELHDPAYAALKAALGRIDLENDVKRFGAGSPHTRLRTRMEGVDPDEVFSVVPYEKGFLFLCALERAAGREAFDRFLRIWMERWRFRSITTDEFERTFEEVVPGVLEKVGARKWIDEPGVPEDAPTFRAPRLDELRDLAARWEQGARPDPAAATGWNTSEWHYYLMALPERIAPEDAAWLDRTFALTAQGNMEVLVAWLVLAARSGYEPALARTREVLLSVGRMKYLKPLYRALAGRPETLAFAREVAKEAEPGYHAIAAGGVRTILAAAG